MHALGIHNLAGFVAAALLLNLTPGQDSLYMVGQSLAHGRRAGVISVLGVHTGVLIHTAAVALGLAALLASAPEAFRAIQWLGVAYLIWLGIGLILGGHSVAAGAPERTAPDAWHLYRRGVLTNLLNPKVALFFLAFLPQFVTPAAAGSALPLLALGGVFALTGGLWGLMLTLGAHGLTRRLRRSRRAADWLQRIAGVLLIAIGVRLLWQSAR